jgi:phage minor structural protein, N-terminal domain protein
LLYLLDKNVRTVRWNGEPLHEATSAIVKESMNGDFILTVKYPISDTGIYKQIKEDMLIKCPTPVLGPQLFRIKKPVEDNDQLEITAYHITDDIMQRSVKPVKVANQTCSIALSQMVQNAKTDLGDFSFTSDIQEHRTFNMTETENIYSVLLDGKHSIVGTWEGELVRDNFSLTVKKNRGENRGVAITTHKNLKSYQRSKNSQNVVTRIHARSTFKPEGSEHETTIKVTVDSPLINSYPYINEKEYENNNAKTVEELKKWAQAKFTNEGIDKVSDSIKLEAYELDGQIVHLGDTVNLKSLKHNVDIFKKAVAYEYDGLKEEYISLEFDDKAGFGGSGVSNGLSDVTNAILGVTYSAQEIAIERAARNANLAFEHQSNQLKKEVEDGIELIKAKSEENKRSLSDEINQKFHDFSPEGFEEAKAKAEEALKKAGAGYELADEAKNRALENIRDLNAFKTSVQEERENLSDELKRYSREETESRITSLRESFGNRFVARSTYLENVEGTNRRFEALTRDNEAKLAEYKQGIDGRIATITSQIAGKVNEADFQRVKETAQLYERILGGAENDVSRNISRMVLSNQIFQTEVGKYSTQGGPNMLRNSRADDGLKYWTEADGRLGFTAHSFYFNGQKRMFELRPGAVVKSPRFIVKRSADYTLNFLGFDNNSKYLKIYFCKRKKGSTADFEEKQLIYDGKPKWTNGPVFDNEKTIKKSFQFNIGNFDDGYLQFEYDRNNPNKWGGLFMTELDFYEGTNDRKWQPAPEDSAEPIEAVRTQMTLLAGSYAIQNLNSAGDIINGINLGANGNNRIVGKATHITGDTLIDNAVIKSAMIDKLKTANFEAGSVTTTILGAEAVTAEKVKFDAAFIQKLVSQQAFIDELFAKQATITQIQSIDFTGNNIRGGKISSLNSVTDFDLQTGWIDMNKEAVGIRNRFPGKPMQFLIFGQGSLNGVNGAYTQLMSNRNGVTGIEHTSAGIQIWNGKQGENIQTAITFYGKLMDFMPNSLGGGITVNTENRTISNLDNIYFRGTSLATILDLIDKNFIGIEKHFKHNKLGAPGRYTIRI